MFIALKTKIWLTVLSIVLLFTFFSLYYFPFKQEQSLLKNYNNEVQNLSNTVALGVKIALKEQNYEGVQTAMEYVKETPGLKFVSLLQIDTVWDKKHSSFEIKKTVFSTYPQTSKPDPDQTSSDSVVVKVSSFETEMMNGAIMVGLSTDEIIENQKKIKNTSLLVSSVILLIGILMGFWLARNISVPVRALRDAALLVSQGDMTPVIKNFSRDEIGELSVAFNKMVKDISKAREDLYHTNHTLSDTNKLLNDTLDNLKSAQAQLIHSEKMASLGELTAGIAHEIQNPLNFVNNFSEVNTELIEELETEIESGNFEEVKSLAKDIKQNEQKIVHHGKRADAIVKGMLLHSRTSSHKKEPTDINALCDEYLRLAYHGLRAKDKTFNAAMKTDFDPNIGLIDVVPQDIGRVILNLITNAFYAVSHTTTTTPSAPTLPPSPLKGGQNFPTVTITTSLLPPLGGKGGERNAGKAEERNAGKAEERNAGKAEERNAGKGGERNAGKGGERNAGKGEERNAGKGEERNAGKGEERNAGKGEEGTIAEIRISDNGPGIPKEILDKIFQPFFTTKPTGQGTGLGLSLSYDIIKAHGGELNVETKEGEGTTFIIQLPMN